MSRRTDWHAAGSLSRTLSLWLDVRGAACCAPPAAKALRPGRGKQLPYSGLGPLRPARRRRQRTCIIAAASAEGSLTGIFSNRRTEMSTVEPQTLRGGSYLPTLGCILLLLVMAVLPYLRVITQGYFLGDDFALIQLYSSKSAKDFLPLFAGDVSMGIWGQEMRYLRPLLGVSYKTDYALWGVNAGGFHASNVLWHALNVVLLFFVSYLLTGKDRMTALLSAALFAAVPVHAEAVAWIPGRNDVIYGFFWLASVLCLVCFLRSDST